MKKMLLFLFCLILVLNFTSCNNNGKTINTSNNSSIIVQSSSQVENNNAEKLFNESDINHSESSNTYVAKKDGWLYFCINGQYSETASTKNNKIIRINEKTLEIQEIYKGNEGFFGVKLKDDSSLIANYINPIYSDDKAYIKDYDYKSLLIDINTEKVSPYDDSITYNNKKSSEIKSYKEELYFSIQNEENSEYAYKIYKKDSSDKVKFLYASQRNEINVLNNRIYYFDKTKIYSLDINGTDKRLIANLSENISLLSINKNYALCFTDKNSVMCNLTDSKTVSLKNRYDSWNNVFLDNCFYTISTEADEKGENLITNIYKITFDGTEEKIASQNGYGYRLYTYGDYLYFYTGENSDSPITFNEHIYRLNMKTNKLNKLT